MSETTFKPDFGSFYYIYGAMMSGKTTIGIKMMKELDAEPIRYSNVAFDVYPDTILYTDFTYHDMDFEHNKIVIIFDDTEDIFYKPPEELKKLLNHYIIDGKVHPNVAIIMISKNNTIFKPHKNAVSAITHYICTSNPSKMTYLREILSPEFNEKIKNAYTQKSQNRAIVIDPHQQQIHFY